MEYNIRMGIPEMEELWNRLQTSYRNGTISKKDAESNKWGKKDVLGLRSESERSYDYWIRTTSEGFKEWSLREN